MLTIFPTSRRLRNRKSNRGVYSQFFILDGIGCKTFTDRRGRDDSFWKQDWLHHAGCAPRVGNTFELTLNGRTVYGHTTEIAETLVSTDGKANENADGCCVFKQFDERKDRDEVRSDVADCMDRLHDAGCYWEDNHPGNFGYVNSRIVIIDCGGVKLPHEWDGWQDDSPCNDWRA